jgi:hypothetical protein
VRRSRSRRHFRAGCETSNSPPVPAVLRMRLSSPVAHSPSLGRRLYTLLLEVVPVLPSASSVLHATSQLPTLGVNAHARHFSGA